MYSLFILVGDFSPASLLSFRVWYLRFSPQALWPILAWHPSPTSIRDAPHACLISSWAKAWCTITPHHNWRRLWEELVPQQVRPLEMKGSSPRQAGHVDSQRQDNFLNLERERDQDKQWEGSVNTSHTSRSRSKGKGHASQKRRRSRTPPSETFSYEKEQPHKRGHKSPSYQGLANDAMSEALDPKLWPHKTQTSWLGKLHFLFVYIKLSASSQLKII